MANWYVNPVFKNKCWPILIFLSPLHLGDTGYPLTPWLMTPLINPQSQQELAYNEAHKKTRSVIEHTNGI